MSERVWYTYQDEKQLGPFNQDQVKQLIVTKTITPNSFVFKVGWKDWVLLRDVLAEFDMGTPPPPPVRFAEEAGKRPPRASIHGRVIVHNDGQLVLGSGVNISSTGIFIETPDLIFKLEEKLKLTCQVQGIKSSFNVTAQVIRFNDDSKMPVGYGLRFLDLDSEIEEAINQLIKGLELSV